MDAKLGRGLAVELLGTFAVVYFPAAAMCVNSLAAPEARGSATALQALQPGLVGLALAQAAILVVMISLSMRFAGGFVNPAITLMLWVFNRLDTKRMALLLAAQLAGAFLAGACVRFSFDDQVLREARLGTPHLNSAAFRAVETGSIAAGASIELILTFFLVFAIFGARQEKSAGDGRPWAAWAAGLVMLAGSITAGPLTGASANPARWFGVAVWEQLLQPSAAALSPWSDTFVFLAGPILGALLAGLVTIRWLAKD